MEDNWCTVKIKKRISQVKQAPMQEKPLKKHLSGVLFFMDVKAGLVKMTEM